jgi:hypothetical protein
VRAGAGRTLAAVADAVLGEAQDSGSG